LVARNLMELLIEACEHRSALTNGDPGILIHNAAFQKFREGLPILAAISLRAV